MINPEFRGFRKSNFRPEDIRAANKLYVLLFLPPTQTSSRNTHSSWSGCTEMLGQRINTMQFKEDRSVRVLLRSRESLAVQELSTPSHPP